MKFLASSVERLHSQFEAISILIPKLEDEMILQRPESGKWSIHENLAHLGRYHEIFNKRLERMLYEDQPLFRRYKAEEDPGTELWVKLSTPIVMKNLLQKRKVIEQRLLQLGPEELSRKGVHPKLGVMPIPLWLEFFLLHEAHHLYTIFWILGEFRTK